MSVVESRSSFGEDGNRRPSLLPGLYELPDNVTLQPCNSPIADDHRDDDMGPLKGVLLCVIIESGNHRQRTVLFNDFVLIMFCPPLETDDLRASLPDGGHVNRHASRGRQSAIGSGHTENSMPNLSLDQDASLVAPNLARLKTFDAVNRNMKGDGQMRNFTYFPRLARLAGLTLMLGLVPATGAAAQQTAEDLFRQFVGPSGYGSRMVYDNERFPVPDPETGQPWTGLHIDTSIGYARGTDYRGATVVIRNVSGLDYCIRPAYAFDPSQRWTSVSAAEQRTYLIEAGSTHLVFTGSVLGGGSPAFVTYLGFWRPDLSRERICSDVAPAGLEDWARGFSYESGWFFSGSRR